MARYAEFNNLYEIYEKFKTNCLLNDNSYFLPNETIWTLDNIADLKLRLVDNPDMSDNKVDAKLNVQMQGASPALWVILAEVNLIYYLVPINNKKGKDTVLSYLKRGYPDKTEFPSDNFWDSITGFSRVGVKYNHRHKQISLILVFAEAVKRLQNRRAFLSDAQAIRTFLNDQTSAMPGYDRAHDMGHALLYLAFPDIHQPILSNDIRRKIIAHYGARLGITEPDEDRALQQIHENIAKEKGLATQDFHFYHIQSEWDKVKNKKISQEAPVVHDEIKITPSLDVGVTNALNKLRFTKNLILTGAPGTGKTYIARRVAQEIISTNNKNGDVNHYIHMVAFHPSYAYEDFIEGMRPVIDATGNLNYKIRPGVLRQICQLASNDPNHAYVLIIDEINRANLSKVFGELITLIEDDKRVGEDNALTLTLPYSGDKFGVPANLYIIGTMNTADRSIALMDMAMRRRFAFVEVAPRPELLGKIGDSEGTTLDLAQTLRILNKRIRAAIGHAYEIGHSYLIGLPRIAPENQIDALEFVWNNQILPLLEEYYYSRPDTLKSVLREFVFEDEASDERLGFADGEDLMQALRDMVADKS